MSLRLLSTFFSVKFSVVVFMLRSLIHFYFNSVHESRYGSIFLFYLLLFSYAIIIYGRCFVFSIEKFWVLLKNLVFTGMWINSRIFSSIPLVQLSVLMPISSFIYIYFYYSSIVVFAIQRWSCF